MVSSVSHTSTPTLSHPINLSPSGIVPCMICCGRLRIIKATEAAEVVLGTLVEFRADVSLHARDIQSDHHVLSEFILQYNGRDARQQYSCFSDYVPAIDRCRCTPLGQLYAIIF